ncbi:MAG TPA: hypothetical protein VIT20_05895 [Propionibacteriaceae bacterium]
MTTTTAGLVQTPARPRSLVVTSAATGVAVMLAVMLIYVLIRIGFHVAVNHTVPAGGTALPTPDTPDRIFGVYVIGSMITLAPSMLAGGAGGALLGVVMRATWRRQSLLGSWLTGSLLACVLSGIVNGMVLIRSRTVPLRFSEWAPLLGYPSIIFIVVMGGLGVWLFTSPARDRD